MSFKLRMLIARNLRAHANLVLQHTAETSERRTRRNTMNTFNDAIDKTIIAIREKRQAEAERDRAVELVRQISIQSEGYRRAVEYLLRAWQPTDPTEGVPSDGQVRAWLDHLKREVETNEAWRRDQEDRLAQALQDARERAR